MLENRELSIILGRMKIILFCETVKRFTRRNSDLLLVGWARLAVKFFSINRCTPVVEKYKFKIECDNIIDVFLPIDAQIGTRYGVARQQTFGVPFELLDFPLHVFLVGFEYDAGIGDFFFELSATFNA